MSPAAASLLVRPCVHLYLSGASLLVSRACVEPPGSARQGFIFLRAHNIWALAPCSPQPRMGGPGGSAPRLENFWRFRGGQNAILTKFSRHGRSQPLTQKPNPGREIAINRTRHTLSPRRPRLRCLRLRCPRKPRKLSRRGRSIRSYRLSGTCARSATHPGLPCARNTPPRIPACHARATLRHASRPLHAAQPSILP